MESHDMNTSEFRNNRLDRIRRLALRSAAGLGIAAILAGPAYALKPGAFRSQARSIETSSDLVSLPAPGGQVVVARGCDSCDPVSLSLAPTTVFRINNRTVDYAEFRNAALDGSHLMTVHYHGTTLEIIKIRLENND
jgi:hypothetical protein